MFSLIGWLHKADHILVTGRPILFCLFLIDFHYSSLANVLNSSHGVGWDESEPSTMPAYYRSATCTLPVLHPHRRRCRAVGFSLHGTFPFWEGENTVKMKTFLSTSRGAFLSLNVLDGTSVTFWDFPQGALSVHSPVSCSCENLKMGNS